MLHQNYSESTTQRSERTAGSSYIVFYDEKCSLCVYLARAMEKHESRIQCLPHSAMSEFAKGLGIEETFDARSLWFWDGQDFHKDKAAWRELLKTSDRLKHLQWLAVKLGVDDKLPGVVRSGAHLLKRFCRRCR